MATVTAAVPTTNGSRYMQQLCKHWGHKFEVSFDPQGGRVALPFGPVAGVETDDGALREERHNLGGAEFDCFFNDPVHGRSFGNGHC